MPYYQVMLEDRAGIFFEMVETIDATRAYDLAQRAGVETRKRQGKRGMPMPKVLLVQRNFVPIGVCQRCLKPLFQDGEFNKYEKKGLRCADCN